MEAGVSKHASEESDGEYFSLCGLPVDIPIILCCSCLEKTLSNIVSIVRCGQRNCQSTDVAILQES